MRSLAGRGLLVPGTQRADCVRCHVPTALSVPISPNHLNRAPNLLWHTVCKSLI